jgi:hypothetical protein
MFEFCQEVLAIFNEDARPPWRPGTQQQASETDVTDASTCSQDFRPDREIR